MTRGFKAVAQRMVNAEIDFIATLKTFKAMTDDEARHVLAVYIANKLVKLDAVGGRYNAKTGRIFDVDVIERAQKA